MGANETRQTEPFGSGCFMILAFDHGTGEQLIPFTPSIADSIVQATYDEQDAAEEQARLLAERAPSYLTFAVVRIEQVATVAGAVPAKRQGDSFEAVRRRLEGLPWGCPAVPSPGAEVATS